MILRFSLEHFPLEKSGLCVPHGGTDFRSTRLHDESVLMNGMTPKLKYVTAGVRFLVLMTGLKWNNGVRGKTGSVLQLHLLLIAQPVRPHSPAACQPPQSCLPGPTALFISNVSNGPSSAGSAGVKAAAF